MKVILAFCFCVILYGSSPAWGMGSDNTDSSSDGYSTGSQEHVSRQSIARLLRRIDLDCCFSTVCVVFSSIVECFKNIFSSRSDYEYRVIPSNNYKQITLSSDEIELSSGNEESGGSDCGEFWEKYHDDSCNNSNGDTSPMEKNLSRLGNRFIV